MVISGLPSAVTAGSPVSFHVSKLDLTSLGGPANTSLTASIDGASVGTFPVTTGAATVTFTVPPTLAGPKTLSLVAAGSNTTVTIELTVAKKPSAKGTVAVDPATVRAGGSVAVRLAAWDPMIKLTVDLDGKTLFGEVVTDGKGAATLQVEIARGAKAGAHSVVATTPDRMSNSAALTVTRYCVPFPGRNAPFRLDLQWLLAWLWGWGC